MTHPFFIPDTDGTLRPLASIERVIALARPHRNRATTLDGEVFDLDPEEVADLTDRFLPNTVTGLDLVQLVTDDGEPWFAQSPVIAWRVTCDAVRPVCAFTARPEGEWCLWERDTDRVFLDEVLWEGGGLAAWKQAALEDRTQVGG